MFKHQKLKIMRRKSFKGRSSGRKSFSRKRKSKIVRVTTSRGGIRL